MWVISILFTVSILQFQYKESTWGDLTYLTLEQLANIEVTSATHAPVNQWEVAQTIYVITHQELQNHGITHLAEALRLVPAIHVARNTASSWATGIRGFSDDLSRGILVLMDGRSVYNNLFAGVFWANQDLPIDIIDRIEVILGPGGSVWGANAVHGVINLITKRAAETQGGFTSGSGGTVEAFRSTLRYGGTLGRGHYRIWGQYTEDDSADHSDNMDFDAWEMRRLGLRIDQDFGFTNLSIQAGYIRTNLGERYPVPDSTGTQTIAPISSTQSAGHFISANLKTWVGDFQWRTKACYQNDEQDADILDFEIDTFNLETDFVNENRWGTSTFGALVRSIEDESVPSQSLRLTPSTDQQWIKGIFFEHQTWQFQKSIMINVGAKVEDSPYTDWEWQPRVGVSYLPNSDAMVWASVSRAIRAPTRLERDITSFGLIQEDSQLIRFEGSDQFQEEVLNAFEIGSRFILKHQNLKVSLFRQHHDRLVSTEIGSLTTTSTPYGLRQILLVQPGNGINATSRGGEFQWSYWPEGVGQFSFRYAYQDLDVTLDPSSRDLSARLVKGESPRHQFQITSFIPLKKGVNSQAMLRWVDDLPSQEIHAYWEVDANLQFQLGQSAKLRILGRNLLHDKHAEFNKDILHPRQFAAELQWWW